MLLNFHTHQLEKQTNEQVIFNLIIPESDEALENFPSEKPNSWLSVGIHPWYINENNQKFQLEKLRQLAQYQEVKLIGECGLDRIKGSSLPLQEEIFIKQIRIAEDLKKPIVVHCVRCFNELIAIEKIIRPKVPLIVHGFNNNLSIAQSLLKQGFYLSLGAALMNEESNAVKVLQQMPLEKLFLETDDTTITIQKIYEKASFLLNISLNTLEDVIFANYLIICGK
jgi:TatD DNase family protein